MKEDVLTSGILAFFALSKLWILTPYTSKHQTFIIQCINFGIRRPKIIVGSHGQKTFRKATYGIHTKMQMEDYSMRLNNQKSKQEGGSLNMRDPSNFCCIQAMDIDAINAKASNQSNYESSVCTNTRKLCTLI